VKLSGGESSAWASRDLAERPADPLAGPRRQVRWTAKQQHEIQMRCVRRAKGRTVLTSHIRCPLCLKPTIVVLEQGEGG